MSKRAQPTRPAPAVAAEGMPPFEGQQKPLQQARHVRCAQQMVNAPGRLNALCHKLEELLAREDRPVTLNARDRVNIRRAIEALHVLRADRAQRMDVWAEQATELIDLRMRLQTAKESMRDLLGAIE